MSLRALRNEMWLARVAAARDKLRFWGVTLTAACVAIVVLGASSVASITSADGPYANPLLQQAGLRRGLIIGLLLVAVPLIALVVQCSQLAAPSRNRRLATYRLFGGSRRALRRIAALEVALPAAIGTLVGIASYVLGQAALDGLATVWGRYTTEEVTKEGPYATTTVTHVQEGWVRLFPTDVGPSPAVLVVVLVAVPAVCVATAWLALRRVHVEPLGVVRRRKSGGPPGIIPAALLTLGVCGLLGFTAIRTILSLPGRATRADVVIVLAFATVASIGLAFAAAFISARVGALIARHSSSPELVIAGRRLEADPYASSRSLTLVTVAFLIAVAGQGVKSDFLVITDPDDPFYRSVLHMVDVAYLSALALACIGVLARCVESVVSRRQQYAIQLATGVPRRVLRRALTVETIVPLVPLLLLSSVIAVTGARQVLGTEHVRYTYVGSVAHPATISVPVPWAEVSTLLVAVLGLTTLATWCVSVASRRRLDPGELRVSA